MINKKIGTENEQDRGSILHFLEIQVNTYHRNQEETIQQKISSLDVKNQRKMKQKKQV